MITRKRHKFFYNALTCLVLGLFVSTNAVSQNKNISIKNADSQTYKQVDGNDIVWLVGNVIYEHEGALMTCDSSIYFRSENRFNAFGNVRINQGDTLIIQGDMLEYDGSTKLMHLTNNVEMQDGDMTLFCEEITYNRQDATAYYTTGGTFKQNENTLVSKKGFYNANNKRFTFKDSVRLRHPSYTIDADTLRYGSETNITYFSGPTTIKTDSALIYCESGSYDTQNDIAILTQNARIEKQAQTIKGDSIYYQMGLKQGQLYRNVSITDTVNKYVITGGYGAYTEHPESAIITQKPIYRLDIEGDTLFITGDTLRVALDTNMKRRIRVYRHTRFYKSDFQGKSDSLIYTQQDGTFHLYHNPVVWNEDNQLTADFIFMTTRKGHLDSLFMLGNAFLIALETADKYNQIKGRNMYGKFVDNELRSIYVSGNGQTVYYAYDEQDKEIGVNRADCSDLLIRIKTNKVERVTFIKKPNATLYPPGQIPKGELFLKGFNQRFSEKLPSKEAFLDL